MKSRYISQHCVLSTEKHRSGNYSLNVLKIYSDHQKLQNLGPSLITTKNYHQSKEYIRYLMFFDNALHLSSDFYSFLVAMRKAVTGSEWSHIFTKKQFSSSQGTRNIMLFFQLVTQVFSNTTQCIIDIVREFLHIAMSRH